MPRKPKDPDAESCQSQAIKTPGRHLKIQITSVTPSDSNSSRKPSSCSGSKIQHASFESSPDIKSLKLGDNQQSRNGMQFKTVCKDLRTSFNLQKSGLLSPFHSKGLTTVDPNIYDRHKKRATQIVSSAINQQLFSPCSKRSKTKFYHKREGSPCDSEQLESIENLYTLKKIQNKVRDKVV